MKRTLLLVMMAGLGWNEGFGQKQNNIWCFGSNVGLDFNSGVPMQFTGLTVIVYEGCSSISDSTGQLLLYYSTDAIRNRNYQIMPNGWVYSGNSPTQILIVPHPGSSKLYYIFIPTDENDMSFNYSLIDLGQDGGLGDVITKNVKLYSPTCQKVAAVRHANGKDFWVLSHQFNSDAFYAYRLKADGIDTSAIITHIGKVHGPSTSTSKYVGQMKFSPDGTKLALVTFGSDGWVEVFDFDNNSGVISSFVTDITPNFGGYYGIEFSPNSSKLYTIGFNGYTSFSYLFQYDLAAGTPTDILASRTIIDTGSGPEHWALQLGPNGKIYTTSNDHTCLNIIHSPNSLGLSCNYQSKGFSLIGSAFTQLGLPSFVVYPTPSCMATFNGIIIAVHDTVCKDQPPVLHFSGVIQNVQWQYSTDSINYTDLVGLTGEDCLDIPTQTSYYRVKSTDGNCPLITNPIRIVVDTTCQITGLGKDNKVLSFYPNPAKNFVSVLTSEPKTTIRITNLLGEVLFSEKVSGRKEIDVSFLPAGMYFVNNGKLVKE